MMQKIPAGIADFIINTNRINDKKMDDPRNLNHKIYGYKCLLYFERGFTI